MDSGPVRRIGTLPEGVVVGKSRIHGCGVFARRSYFKDDVIATFGGRVVSAERTSPFSVQIGPSEFLESDESDLWENLINHSCCPSCIFDCEKRTLIADTTILILEELTFDYNLSCWELESLGYSFPCNCACRDCCGEVAGFMHLRADRQQALFSKANIYIQKLMAAKAE
jgi:hypothetical protein